MRILYVSRLFSGLETSVQNGVWKPTGVPTIYRLIESLEQQADAFNLILTAKRDSAWTATASERRPLHGLKTVPLVLSNWTFGPKALRGIFLELRHFVSIFCEYRRCRPDILYIDHGNVVTASIFARFGNVPVVLRLMGVYPAMRTALSKKRVWDRVLCWAYCAPYQQIIMTQDGSGVEPWITQALNPTVPCKVLLNGVDPNVANAKPQLPPSVEGRSKGRPIVLFLGKLERAKGADRFLDSIIIALKRTPDAFHAIMVGTGSLIKELRERSALEGIEPHVTFVPRLEHSAVASLLKASAVYVSLNRLGNLSNANLEAFSAGVPSIFPQSQPSTGVDIVTDQLIPKEAAIRVSNADATEEIAEAVQKLVLDPGRRQSASKALEAVCQSMLQTWSQRIEMEVLLLRSIANDRP